MENNLTHTLTPAGIPVTAGGRDFIVDALPTCVILENAETVFAIVQELKAAGGQISVPQLLAKHHKLVIALMAAGLEVEPSFIAKLRPAEFIAMARAFFLANLVSFTEGLGALGLTLPMLTQARPAASTARKTSSTTSKASATASKRSTSARSTKRTARPSR